MANDFLVFGGAGGANVITQAAYAALGTRTSGFSSGTANSAQCNKTWRQSSIMAAVLAQFISDRTGQDVLDDGTTATILANLKLSAAAVNGDATKTFSVAPATLSTHAATLGQLSAFQVGRYLGTRQFTASQTYTPTSGTTSVVVELVGGGGAGGNTSITGVGQTSVAGGGGAGGYARSRLTSGFSGVSMTVGAGGLALSTVNGGATSFGALLSATGGTGGPNSPAQTPPVLSIQGHGGAGSSGNLVNSRGGDGMPGIAAQNTSTVSGSGGSSYFGGGGIGQPTGAGPGQTATSPGAGGGGAFAGPSVGASQIGGDGAAGIILVHEFA